MRSKGMRGGADKCKHLCASCAKWNVSCPLEPVYAVTACVEYARRKR